MSKLPTTMTAIEIDGFGGPEVLKPTTRPVPLPTAVSGISLISISA